MNHAAIHARMRAAAAIVRLPLGSARWTGAGGAVPGRGTGNSLEFQDQRAYTPGDDPRQINWQVQARTGELTLKLWREEITPRIDILLDLSRSMHIAARKEERSWELTYFTIESAIRSGGSVRLQRLDGPSPEVPRAVPLEKALAHDWDPPPEAGTPAASLAEQVARAALRAGALRVMVSDLLDPSPPSRICATLVAGGGRAIVLVPTSRAESDPDWSGNVEFEDCELGQRRLQAVDVGLLDRYRQAYARHFTAWREACIRHGIGMARVGEGGSFLAALQAEAIPGGVLEAD